MYFNSFIENLKRDSEFSVTFNACFELTKETLKTMAYPYPFEKYDCKIYLNINGDSATLTLKPEDAEIAYSAKDVVKLFDKCIGQSMNVKVEVDLSNLNNSLIERYALERKIYNADESDPFIDSSYSERHTMIAFDILK